MAFSALDALATICTAELAQSEEKNANSARKRKALASQFQETDLDGLAASTAGAGWTPVVRGSTAFLPLGMSSTSQRSSSRPAFVSEPGVPPLPLAPASAQKLATPMSHGPSVSVASALGSDVWTLPAAKRRGVVSAGGMPVLMSLGHANRDFDPAAAARNHDMMRPLLPYPLETPDLPRKLPQHSPASDLQPLTRARSPTCAAWQHPAPLRVSPTGSGASDGPCSLTGCADLSGTAAASRLAAERLGRSPPCSPSPSPSAAGTDSDAEQQLLLEDPSACVSRIVQSPSKGGPGLLEKMKLAQVLLTHRDVLSPEQVKMVVAHLSNVLQSADAQQLARQAAAQQHRQHHQHHQHNHPHDLADGCQFTSERRLSATAGCSGDPEGRPTTASGSLPIKVSDETMAAATAAGLTGASRGTASSSSSHTRGGEHDGDVPRATACSAPAAAAHCRTYPLARRPAAAPHLHSLRHVDEDDVVLGLAGAGCGGVAGGLLHSNSMECNNNADGGVDVACLGSLLPPRFDSSAASGVSSLPTRPPRRSSSELHMPFSTQQQQQLLPTPRATSPAAARSPQLHSQLGGAARPRLSSQGMVEPAARTLHERSSQADVLLAALAQRAAASGRGFDANRSPSDVALQRLQAQHAQLRGRQLQAAAQLQPQQRQLYPQHPRQQQAPPHGGMVLPVPQLQHALRWGAREAAPVAPAVTLMSATQLQHARRGGMALGASAAGCADGFVFVARQGGDRCAILGSPEGFTDSKALAAAGQGHMLRH